MLPWQQHSSCHSVSFARYISGAKFEDRLREQGWLRVSCIDKANRATHGAGMAQGWRSGESTDASHQCVPGSIPGPSVMWVEFVVGSLPCSERFFFGYSSFPLFSKTNISKFQFDLEFNCQALYHEPMARVIAQALPVFDIKFAFTFTVPVFLEIFLICIIKNVNISTTKKDIPKRNMPFFFTLESFSNKQQLFFI